MSPTYDNLFDQAEGKRLAREGAERARASDDWKASCDLAIKECARRYIEFTSDEVWEVLAGYGVERPPEPRAMGHRMIAAVKVGTITKTNRVQPTRQRKSHHSPKNIWRSNIVILAAEAGPAL